MRELVTRGLALWLQLSPAVRVIGLTLILAALAMAAGAPENWGGGG